MENDKIFVRSVPSLLHLAVVHHATKLYNAFNMSTLIKAFERIQEGISASPEDNQGYSGCDSAQKKLLLIPPFLRTRVVEAIHGLNRGMELFYSEHQYSLEQYHGEFNFYMRCDGSVDTVKTARELVLNPNIDIKERFCIACMYCLKDSIRTLWYELDESDLKNYINDVSWWVTSPWIRWLKNRRLLPWKVNPNNLVVALPAIRISAFFDSLQTEEREAFIHQLMYAASDDVRLCMYAMSKDEEIKLLKFCSMKVLVCCLHWPMRRLFLEKAGEILKYVHSKGYCEFLGYLLSSSVNRKVFDFDYFFKCLWENSPGHLKEKAKESPSLRRKIELCLTQMRLKRKADYGHLGNCSKKIGN